jgi:cell division protein FtsB
MPSQPPGGPPTSPIQSSRTAATAVIDFMKRARWLVPVATIVPLVLVMLGYAVLPTRSWLEQRNEISALQAELTELEAANVALELRTGALFTVAEVTRMARSDLGLIRPGEEAYAVLPPRPEPVRIPTSWPFTSLGEALID